jgi:hypothetical protein
MQMKKKIDATNGRFYPIREGVYYPSATTLLSVMPMNKWFKEYLQIHTKEEADRLLKNAGLQGSKIHHTIDLVLRGETIMPSGVTGEQLVKTALIFDEDYGDETLLSYLKKPYTEIEDKMMRGFFNWYKDFEPETSESELIVWSDKYKYAGTLDWIGYITTTKNKKIRGKNEYKLVKEKVLCIVDWKTGKGLYESYDLQVSSYLKAYCEMHKKNKKIKKPTRAFLLQLGVNKIGYKFQEIKDINTQLKNFLHYQKTWIMNNPEAKPKDPYQFLESYKLT